MNYLSITNFVLTLEPAADKREFIKISQAVGVGFGRLRCPPFSFEGAHPFAVVMGAIGYVVKLSKYLSGHGR